MSRVEIFDRIVTAVPPSDGAILFDTVCVLGGSIAGLLAARVLSDHSRHVVILERDSIEDDRRIGNGVPQEQHVHGLNPAGRQLIGRWLPGFEPEVSQRGAVSAPLDRIMSYADGQPLPHPPIDDVTLLLATRPLFESVIRGQVLALPNVSVQRTAVTGLAFADGAVTGVRHADGVLAADFTVDAMGRASKLSDWLGGDGYSRPVMKRLRSGINYSTIRLRRSTALDNLPYVGSLAMWTPPTADGLAIASTAVVEDDQWLVTVVGYDDDKPGRTIEEFRSIGATLPDPFPVATAGEAMSELATFHQADSRRRDFTGLTNFPRRLVSVGDAAASFNPIYGQGMTSAALHAACLALYLDGSPDLDRPAESFFELQKVVVDAAWQVSAGGDAARLDAISGAEVAPDVQRQRWELGQILMARAHDAATSHAFQMVGFMLAHPDTLTDPAVLDRAVAVNQQYAAASTR